MSPAMRVMKTAIFLLLLPATAVQAQQVLTDRERVDFDSPEGWAMAHTLAATLNLGSVPPTIMEPWRLVFSAEVGSIPRLSKAEQRVGFGGFKYEDMNKSPVFGKGRVHLGLPGNFSAVASWTPPLRLNGAKPRGVFGLALEKQLFAENGWGLGGRLYALRGDGTGDITCDKDTAAGTPGTAANPFGCRAPSNDRLSLDHQGFELMASRMLAGERWQPYVALAWTRTDPSAQVNARVFEIIDRSVLTSDGNLTTATVGVAFHPSANWSWSAAFSYTPLDVRRPPLRKSEEGDFWSVRIGLSWNGGLPWQ
ncbi:MAG: hypothetical protein Q8N34_07210 [Gammaproteobacteria bacterium]|nr:hypothetical protein [Gammaproteobacteria bacterium]